MSKNKVMLEIPVSAEALTTARSKHGGLEQAIANFINGIAETGSGGRVFRMGIQVMASLLVALLLKQER